MRVFLSSLGCKLNRAETERLARTFVDAGHRIAPSLESADLHVVNTCTVTHAAARDSRKLARRGWRLNPELRTVLTGCFVDASPNEAARLPGVDLVVANRAKERLLDHVEEAFAESMATATSFAAMSPPHMPFGNTRPLVKIEDGCNMRCAFCVIPSTRGGQTSLPIETVLEEIQRLAATGAYEVVLTGVQISSYRWRSARLFHLVKAILESTDVSRLRLTSIAPWQFDTRVLDLFETGRLCRHFHLSLQSGSDAVLRRMRRPYTTAVFRTLLETIRDRVPATAITTDIIVGFPGESEAEFEASLRFVEEAAFARIHAFPYSERAGTEAARMGGEVEHSVVRERMERLLAVASAAKRRFETAQLGTTTEAVWERRRGGRWLGLTDNYIRVVSAAPCSVGEASRVRLVGLLEGGVGVEPVEPSVQAHYLSPPLGLRP